MLHHPKKSLSTHLSKSISRQFSLHLQQFRSKFSCSYDKGRFKHNGDGGGDDGGGERARRRKENPEGHLQLYKSRGQHLLTNPRVLDSILRCSNIKSTDTVLEIGPGTGNLTVKLLEVASKVVAVEIDKRMVESLQNRVTECGLADKLTVICQDALKTEFPDFDIIVANIPYGISSPLVAKLVFGAKTFRSATLLLQKEFAKRLLVNPGDSEFNRLAVNVKLVADVEFIMNVSKRDFVPIPKVDSSVVKIYPKADIPDVNLDEWWAFTRTCFGNKNKTLGAAFKQKKKVTELRKLSEGHTGYGEESMKDDAYDSSDDGDVDDEEEYLETGVSSFKEKVVGILKDGGFEDKRPSKLSNEELMHLLSLFNEAGIRFHDQAKPRDMNAIFAAA